MQSFGGEGRSLRLGPLSSGHDTFLFPSLRDLSPLTPEAECKLGPPLLCYNVSGVSPPRKYCEGAALLIQKMPGYPYTREDQDSGMGPLVRDI